MNEPTGVPIDYSQWVEILQREITTLKEQISLLQESNRFFEESLIRDADRAKKIEQLAKEIQ